MAQAPNLSVLFKSAFEEVGKRLALQGDLWEIFSLVQAEFLRARDLHGDQTHLPLGTGLQAKWLLELDDYVTAYDNASVATAARRRCQDAALTPDGDTWEKIITEEYAEMLAEDDPAKFETEAVQVIAMLFNAIMAARKVAAADA